MNIAFLSSLNPTDIHNWSGTLYYMYHHLEKNHRLTWTGRQKLEEAIQFHRENFGEDTPFSPEKYARLFGKMLTDLFHYECYDLIICRDYFFLAYLTTEIPVIYIGDTTCRLFNQYLKITDSPRLDLAEELEERAIQKATHIVYASEWAKNSAINHYHAAPEKISVIEFGANIDNIPEYTGHDCTSACNLLFIGKNWEMKGGNKAIDVFRSVKQKGIPCTLTIIGSTPAPMPKDADIVVYPYIDKSSAEGQKLFEQILRQSHYLIAPTLFDCFGIVYCEASAYGIPVLTTDVGGISQAVRNGHNGFLFAADAPASDYADKIIDLYTHKDRYANLGRECRKHFETCLNWNVWEKRMNDLLVSIKEREEGTYIPVYAINMKEREERRKHIVREFEGKPEFEFHLVEACTHSKGTIGLWNSIVKVIKMAKEQEEDVIVICEDDHFFTENYSPGLLFKEIREAYMQGAELLSGGIGGFGQAIPVGYHRYWVDWFWSTQFIVIYSSAFDTILSYEFQEDDTADGVLSEIIYNKMVIYPFISEQKDFGYSDVTLGNMEYPGKIREFFKRANARFKMIRTIQDLSVPKY